MTTWPEFEFDSEFESASEYSTNTADSSPASASAVHSKISVNPVPNCQVMPALLWNHNTQSYQRSCPALDPVKRQPNVVEKRQPLNGRQEKPPVAAKSKPLNSGARRQPQIVAKNQTQRKVVQSPVGIRSKPPVGVEKQLLDDQADQPQVVQPARKQPLKIATKSQPPDLPPDPDPDPETQVNKEDWG